MRQIGERELMARRCGRDKSLPLQIAGRLAVMPVGGGVPDAPQVSSSQQVGRRAASPLAAAEGEGFLPAMPKIKGR